MMLDWFNPKGCVRIDKTLLGIIFLFLQSTLSSTDATNRAIDLCIYTEDC